MDKNQENKNFEGKKDESWLKIEDPDGKVDYSLVDYSKYFKLINPIHDSILLINKKFPLIKEIPNKNKLPQKIPDEINIKLLAKKYFDNIPLIEKYTLETIKILKPKVKNLSITFFLYEVENNEYLKQIDESLTEFMGDKFTNLKIRVRLHINLFFYILTLIEKEVLNKYLVDYDINILYWATLYHDIGKHQKLHKIYS